MNTQDPRLCPVYRAYIALCDSLTDYAPPFPYVQLACPTYEPISKTPITEGFTPQMLKDVPRAAFLAQELANFLRALNADMNGVEDNHRVEFDATTGAVTLVKREDWCALDEELTAHKHRVAQGLLL